MEFLPETTQTAYSTLLQKLRDSRLARLGKVGFTQKSVNGKSYWYCQYTDVSGARRQRYLGPDSAETLALVDEVSRQQESYAAILSERKRLVAMITSGGGNMEKGRPARIIEKLTDAGVFEAGGMLVGSYAFACYGNLLGVVFDSAMRRTEDMDVAYDRSIEIGFVRDIRGDIAEAAPDMVEPRQINPWVPPYEMIAPDGFKIEFLTSKLNALDKSPVPLERFGIHAQPLEFMDYLIEGGGVEAAVLYGAGMLVNVPDPARFVVHKLAVSQLRAVGQAEKGRKDLQQAGALAEYLLEQNPGTLILAAEAAKARDDMLYSVVRQGMRHLPNRDLAATLKQECGID